MPPEIGWRGGVRDGEADGTTEDPAERGLPQAQDAEACDEGGGQPVSAGDKPPQTAELELTHPQQRYHPDLFRSGGDDITYAGRQDGEAAAGVARRGRIHS